MNKNLCPSSVRRSSRSKGSVLAIVLIVLVVMMLGGVSTLRSIDTSALLSGNLAFKRDSVNRSSIGLNSAFKVIQDNFVNDPKNCNSANAGCQMIKSVSSVSDCNPADAGCPDVVTIWKSINYWPRLLASDANGIPLILKNKTEFDENFKIKVSAVGGASDAGSEVRFLIERMCTDYGPTNEKKCSVSDKYELGGSYRQDKPGSVSLPLYRITVRSDGVRNTQTYMQALVTTRVK